MKDCPGKDISLYDSSCNTLRKSKGWCDLTCKCSGGACFCVKY